MANKAPTPQKVLLFGATGVIGKYIAEALVNDRSSFRKIGIFTSAGTAKTKAAEIQKLEDQGVEVVVGDVNVDEDVRNAYKDYDTIVSALGRNVILTQIRLLDLASQSPQIHTFFPSEYGTDIEYGPASATEKPHQLKLQVRKHIRDGNVPGLNITYLVTGPYSDLYFGKSRAKGDAERAGTFDAEGRRAVLLGTGDERISFTTMADVGKLLVAALKTPESESESPRTLIVNSFTTTPNEILAAYEKETGTKWDVSYTPLDTLKKWEEEAWEKGDPMATLFTLRRIWTEGGTLYRERDNGKIGEPGMETLEEQVRKILAK